MASGWSMPPSRRSSAFISSAIRYSCSRRARCWYRPGVVLRITTAAGALVLVHNIYGQAAPASRSNIRFAMLGLALIWIYDLNLYTVLYYRSGSATRLIEWRGLAVAAAAPLFALATRSGAAWRVRLSRAATFQSLSLLAICAYFALMAILATALRGTGVDWSSSLMVVVLAVMTVGAMVLIPSARARGWAKVKLAKHLFEHRYDYRTEWLRFTETLGRAGPDAPPLSERIVKAFADIADAPGGLLLVSDGGRGLAVATALNWPGANPGPAALEDAAPFWGELETAGRVIEFEGLRNGWARAEDKALNVPQWLLDETAAWAGIPLLHQQRLVGLVLLAAPEYRRQLDWEDFDLLRTGGNQAASSLAEALGRKRSATRSGSRNSTAASRSSFTTSRTWSASSRCSRATPNVTPTIRSSGPTWWRRSNRRSAR